MYLGGISVFLFCFSFIMQGQIEDYPLELKVPYFVDTSNNILEYEKGNMNNLFDSINSFILKGNGRINIVHFGGSHIQAAIYTEQFKKRLNNNFYGIIRSAGFVFPFKIAHTNSPVYYNSTYSGKWSVCRNVKIRKNCTIGVGGISATTYDSAFSTTIFPQKDNETFSFDKVTLMYSCSGSNYKAKINGKTIILDTTQNHIEVDFNNYKDTLYVKFYKTDSSINSKFTLYGFILDKKGGGILYNVIGINGASTHSFLSCKLFKPQLSLLKPDLAIFSLGTNDAYGKKFNVSLYVSRLDSLISWVREVNPECKIIITVPNDDYYRRRYPNKNTLLQQKAIKNLASNQNIMVWDLLQIMGGYGSSLTWYRNGLMRYDRIHFTLKGYQLKGDLFFVAFMKSYAKYLKTHHHKEL